MVEFLVNKIHDPRFMTMLFAAIAAAATVYTLVMPLFALALFPLVILGVRAVRRLSAGRGRAR